MDETLVGVAEGVETAELKFGAPVLEVLQAATRQVTVAVDPPVPELATLVLPKSSGWRSETTFEYPGKRDRPLPSWNAAV